MIGSGRRPREPAPLILAKAEPRHRGESCDEVCSVRENLQNDTDVSRKLGPYQEINTPPDRGKSEQLLPSAPCPAAQFVVLMGVEDVDKVPSPAAVP